MKLKAYLKLAKLSDADFALSIGRSRSAVRKWIYGQRTPRPADMRLIADRTKGAVTANDFMPEQEVAA